jgi:queuine/archaeosine tRNA-ribosyltransferase
LHNLAWLFDFVARLRASILEGRFEAFRAETHEVWG